MYNTALNICTYMYICIYVNCIKCVADKHLPTSQHPIYAFCPQSWYSRWPVLVWDETPTSLFVLLIPSPATYSGNPTNVSPFLLGHQLFPLGWIILISMQICYNFSHHKKVFSWSHLSLQLLSIYYPSPLLLTLPVSDSLLSHSQLSTEMALAKATSAFQVAKFNGFQFSFYQTCQQHLTQETLLETLSLGFQDTLLSWFPFYFTGSF